MQNESYIWNWLKAYSPFNDFAIAGIMANMQGESAGLSNNLEDRVNNLLGVTDVQYTERVDNGIYDRNFFCTENGNYGGYGLCQWTEKTRSGKLYDFAKSTNRSIGNITMQLEFMMKELSSDFIGVKNSLLTANNLLSAVTVFCERYEIPANPAAQTNIRYKYAEEIYARNHGTAQASTTAGAVPQSEKTDNAELINLALDIIEKLKEFVEKCQTQ